MKVLIMLNGMTHYFNLITSKINEQPGVEIFYIHPTEKSAALGDGVYETKEGVNFELIALKEKKHPVNGWLYYEGLSDVLGKIRPDILMLAETHLESIMYDKENLAVVKNAGTRVVLKSIPFRILKYNDALHQFRAGLATKELPEFKSLPAPLSILLKKIGLNRLYKKAVLDRKATIAFRASLDRKVEMYNFVDAHVNYIDAAYDIYGSYKVPANKIFITYNSPDTDTYFAAKEQIAHLPPILASNPYRIIHLSRLVEWKRVDMLIKAVAAMKHTYPGMELLVVGDGPERETLEQLSADLGVQKAVHFLGGVYDPQLFGQYITSASIYVLAGMGGLSINDAMIFGLPVICSVCDGTEKYLVREGYNGLFFEEGSQESLQEKIGYLFSNPDRRKQMGDNSARIIREEINIHKVVERYMAAFNAVTSTSVFSN